MTKPKKDYDYVRRTATVTLADGTKKRISARADTEKEAFKKLAKMQAEYELGVRALNNKTPFRIWSENYLEVYYKPKVQSATYKNKVNMIKKYIYPQLGNIPIGDIRLTHVQTCLRQFTGQSQDHIKKAKQILSNIFDKAILNDMILKNPVTGVDLPKASVFEPRRALTDAEIEVFKQTVSRHEKGTMFACQFACGLRSQEVRGLKWQDINFKDKTITIKQAVESGKRTTKTPKTNAGFRTIPISDWLYPLLKNHIRDISTDFVFFGTGKEAMTSQRFIRAWSSFLREMDIVAGAKLYRNEVIEHAIAQDITPYYLRHTYATKLAERGVDIKTAQKLLGHSDIKMTANIYTHVTDKMLEDAREKINKMF